jgi:hypothetical protein
MSITGDVVFPVQRMHGRVHPHSRDGEVKVQNHGGHPLPTRMQSAVTIKPIEEVYFTIELACYRHDYIY